MKRKTLVALAATAGLILPMTGVTSAFAADADAAGGKTSKFDDSNCRDEYDLLPEGLVKQPTGVGLYKNLDKARDFYTCLKVQLGKGNESKLNNEVWVDLEKQYQEVLNTAIRGEGDKRVPSGPSKNDTIHAVSRTIGVEGDNHNDNLYLEAQFKYDKILEEAVRGLNAAGLLNNTENTPSDQEPSYMELDFNIADYTTVNNEKVEMEFKSDLFTVADVTTKAKLAPGEGFSHDGDKITFTGKLLPSFTIKANLRGKAVDNGAKNLYSLVVDKAGLPAFSILNGDHENNAKDSYDKNDSQFFTYNGVIRGKVIANEAGLRKAMTEAANKAGLPSFLVKGIIDAKVKEYKEMFTFDIANINSNVLNINYVDNVIVPSLPKAFLKCVKNDEGAARLELDELKAFQTSEYSGISESSQKVVSDSTSDIEKLRDELQIEWKLDSDNKKLLIEARPSSPGAKVHRYFSWIYQPVDGGFVREQLNTVVSYDVKEAYDAAMKDCSGGGTTDDGSVTPTDPEKPDTSEPEKPDTDKPEKPDTDKPAEKDQPAKQKPAMKQAVAKKPALAATGSSALALGLASFGLVLLGGVMMATRRRSTTA